MAAGQRLAGCVPCFELPEKSSKPRWDWSRKRFLVLEFEAAPDS